MNQVDQRDRITKTRVVYSTPGVDAVSVRRDEEYRQTDAGALTMDLYYPPDSSSGRRIPAVIFVTGYSDTGALKLLGCRLKEMGLYISWSQLVAASGLVAITYTNREPATDVYLVLQHVRQHAASLGIDENRIGVWACSGNAPNALSVLMQAPKGALTCAALSYGYMLDLDESSRVADAARQFGFVNPCAGKTTDDLPRDLPLFIARCGQDEMPGLNQTIDRFVGGALGSNLPVTFVNHAAAPHAFDLFDDSEISREIIRQILRFLQFHLTRTA